MYVRERECVCVRQYLCARGMEMLQGSAGVQSALKNAAVCVLLLPRFLLAALMLCLLDFLCIRRKLLLKMQEGAFSSPDDPPLRVSDSNKMFTLESLRAVWYGQKLDFFKSAQLGGAAPNTEVFPLDGDARGVERILDYARGRRPLILNFGSCS